jgi:hypothetical protein
MSIKNRAVLRTLELAFAATEIFEDTVFPIAWEFWHVTGKNQSSQTTISSSLVYIFDLPVSANCCIFIEAASVNAAKRMRMHPTKTRPSITGRELVFLAPARIDHRG